MTVVFPLINYISFKNSVSTFDCFTCPESILNKLSFGDFEEVYDILIFVFVFIGVVISICTYLVHNFQKYSVQRGICILFISTVYMMNSIFSSQMSTFFLGSSNVRIIVDSSGVYILLIISALLFVIKAIFDVFDYKINQSYYINNLKNKRKTHISQKKLKQRRKKLKQGLVQCPGCKYACREEWKKCPICNTNIILKIK